MQNTTSDQAMLRVLQSINSWVRVGVVAGLVGFVGALACSHFFQKRRRNGFVAMEIPPTPYVLHPTAPFDD